MSKFGNNFGIIVIFLLVIVLSGCSNKYIESSEKDLIDREWSVLDAEIVEQDNVGFTLNLKVKDFVEVRDSVNSDVVVQHDNGIRKKVKIREIRCNRRSRCTDQYINGSIY